MTDEGATTNGDHLLATRIDLPIDEIVRRYRAGESEKALAASYGVTRNVIARRLRIAGMERRGMADAIRLAMSRIPSEDKRRWTGPAHIASRGKPHAFDRRCKIALTRQQRQRGASPAELLLARWLADRSIDAVAQKAIGPYNADLGADPIAVEIFGGGWHGYGHHRRRTPERYRHILDRGWAVVVIWVDGRKFPLREAAADYVAAFVERARRDPSVRGKYWVIRGDGKEIAAAQDDLDHIARVPTDG